MKKFLIILAAVLMCCSFSTEAAAQSRKNTKKGYDYKAHAKRNKANAKVNTKRYKASGGDMTKMKCAKKKRSKVYRSKRSRR
jgi:hypothetical protein